MFIPLCAAIVGYCYSIRSERRLCDEVKADLAYRWFCGLGLEDKVPHHSTISVNRHGRFRDSIILRTVFEEVVCGCMKAGLIGGEPRRIAPPADGVFDRAAMAVIHTETS